MLDNSDSKNGGMKATVFVISSVHWYYTWQRHHSIATGLAARGYKVVFIEPIPKRLPSIREAIRVLGRFVGSSKLSGGIPQNPPGAVSVRAPLFLPEHLLGAAINPVLMVPPFASRLVNSYPHRPRIVLNYLPTQSSLSLQNALAPDLAIYDCVRDWSHVPESTADHFMEDEVLDSVEAVFADSDYLYRKMSAMHSKVFRVPPAVDYQHFEKARNDRGSNGERLRTMYFGTVGASVDINLLEKISHRFDLRLVGPIRVSVDGFAKHTELVGSVPYSDLPDYFYGVDVLLLPYKDAAHMPAVIPAKTFECLATGKPVVAMNLESLDEYKDLFYLCESHEEFIQAILESKHESPSVREKRLVCARRNSWQRRIEEIEVVFDELLSIPIINHQTD
jgi:glycosyltransferase involved in cell wall biosynthesis